MAGFGGTLLDAVNKMAQNRAKLNSQKSKFKPNQKGYRFKEPKKTEYNFKNVSKERLDFIISKIRLEAKKEKQRLILKILLITIAVVFFMILFNTIEMNPRIEWLDGEK